MNIHTPKHILLIIFVIACIAPIRAGTQAASNARTEPYEQEFLITAYYSPMPRQCCYIKGGLDADKILNGQGHTTADGSKVFPGIVAAPPNYAFGTKVSLPGLGILEVRDRGGAIRELGNGIHRLDIWVGHGEEGLARALALGAQRVTGTVYPVNGKQPVTQFNLADLSAPWRRIKMYQTAASGLLEVSPKFGDNSYSVVMLQEHLRDAGYFNHAVTGTFGDVTRKSLSRFLSDMRLHEPDTVLTKTTAAFLKATIRRRQVDAPTPFVGPESPVRSIQAAQRILRFLGYYDGRTSGIYDDDFFSAIFRFQQDRMILRSAEEVGAGRIGPQTRSALAAVWNREHIAAYAERLMAFSEIGETLSDRGDLLEEFLGEGLSGPKVEHLQRLLAERGYFPEEKINGVFGALTKQSVSRYQLDEGLIESARDEAAGYVGPATLRSLRHEKMVEWYKKVRGFGWNVL